MIGCSTSWAMARGTKYVTATALSDGRDERDGAKGHPLYSATIMPWSSGVESSSTSSYLPGLSAGI